MKTSLKVILARSGGGGLLPEALAFKDRAIAEGAVITSFELKRLDNIIKGLKAINKYDILDDLLLPGLFSDQIACRLNIINSNYTATLVNSPTFVPRAGWIGNKTDMAIGTGFNPSLSAKIAQNNASYGLYIFKLGSRGAYDAFGASKSGVNLVFANNYTITVQIAQMQSGSYSSADLVNSTPIVGFTTLARNDASFSNYYQNKNVDLTNIKNSVGITDTNLTLLAANINEVNSQFHDCGISAFYAGGYLTKAEHDAIYDVLLANLYIVNGNVLVIGDSTIDAYSGQNAVSSYLTIAPDKTLTDVSEPGETIEQQRTRYNALTTGVKSSIEVAFVQIGLNDLNPAESATTALSKYQTLITDIKTNSPTAKIVCCTMIPCRQRLINVYGATNGPISYQKWLDMNSAIKNNQFSVDYIVSKHTDLLNDGSGNLAAAYNTGDGIHDNNAGRIINASEWLNYKGV